MTDEVFQFRSDPLTEQEAEEEAQRVVSDFLSFRRRWSATVAQYNAELAGLQRRVDSLAAIAAALE